MKKRVKAGITNLLLTVSLGTASAASPQPINEMVKGVMLNSDPADRRMPSAAGIKTGDSSFHHIDTRYKAAVGRLKQQADDLKEYLKTNNYNTAYCFLVDMSIPSGKKRFFVYNLSTDMIEESSLVSHGIGSNNKETDEAMQFSNAPSSMQTSLGKYKIGTSYNGNFGLAFKLYGLDKTNDKAYERTIVLHAHSSIPTTETYPIPISVSLGCPTVAPSFLGTLSNYIKESKKPILMWIYN
jgi:hypothetical protein